MKYLGNPEANLVTMWVAARHLERFGSETLERIHELLRPGDLTSGEGLALSGSLLVGVDLGIFRRDGEVSPVFRPGEVLGANDDWYDRCDEFAALARRQLMKQASGPVESRSDISVGLGWLLSRDWRRDHNALKDADDAPRDAIENRDQARAFARWARDLGFIRDIDNGFRPDPTPALRNLMSRSTSGIYSADEFLETLWPEIPSGPGHPAAPVGREAEDDRETTELFSAVGFALKRLEHDRVVDLAINDDAERRLVFPFPGPTDDYVSVTHVEIRT